MPLFVFCFFVFSRLLYNISWLDITNLIYSLTNKSGKSLQSHTVSLANKALGMIYLWVSDFFLSFYLFFSLLVSGKCFPLPQLRISLQHGRCISISKQHWSLWISASVYESVSKGIRVWACFCVCAFVCVPAYQWCTLCVSVWLLNSMTRTAFWNFLLKCSATSLFASYPKAKLLSFIHSSKAHKWNGRRKCTIFPHSQGVSEVKK